ncbi:carboxylate--amine ligase [Actinosynnema sp. ALI-1.44]|nr:carboxylate--amine ligase [Actinosynnema sp. ALI-1.44]
MGVEEEFFVVDRRGRLSRHAAAVVDAADDQDGELQTELTRSQAELATGVCRDRDDLLGQLRSLRGELATAGARRDLRLLPSGTTPVDEDDPPSITPSPRYQRMADHFGAMIQRVATCGCHVHVGIPDAATGIHVLNHVRPWLPLLLAVTANSPLEAGATTGYRSWRYRKWSQWPSAGPPPVFSSPDHYESVVDGCLRSGAIIDRAMVYWDIRLSEHQPTLEFRISDVAATPDEAVLLAVLIRGLTHAALDTDEPPPDLASEVLRAQLWRAARDGLAGQCPYPTHDTPIPAHTALNELTSLLKPVLRENDDLEFTEDLVARLGRTGGGADRQLRTFDQAGDPLDVVDMLAVAPST